MTVKRKIYVAVSWILVAICMGTIFYLSNQPAEESQAMSDSVLNLLLDYFHIDSNSFIVRKGAHTLEFLGLALLFFNAIYATFKSKFSPYIAWGCTFLYAVSDEIHQIFVEGRACQFRDMLIDGCGALLGVLFGILILFIINKIGERGKKDGDIKTI